MSLIVPRTETVQIREVWTQNLESEFSLIREIVDDFPYVAMDTEFPGIVCRPLGSFLSNSEFNYATLKANVDMLKLIQLGLTFSDDLGNLPTCGTDRGCIWQFNFREFDVQRDISASDSINLLRVSGIDFEKNVEEGVDAQRFAELLMSSGVVLNDSVHWVTFHSGYDFGYLLKILTCQNLPDTQVGFFKFIKIYFPTVYDIKHLMKFCNSLHGGLNKLAELLEVQRVGICHQAGSDSLLTSCAFRKLKESFFNGSTEKYAGVFTAFDMIVLSFPDQGFKYWPELGISSYLKQYRTLLMSQKWCWWHQLRVGRNRLGKEEEGVRTLQKKPQIAFRVIDWRELLSMQKPWLMSPFTFPHISSDKGSPCTLQTKRNLAGWMAAHFAHEKSPILSCAKLSVHVVQPSKGFHALKDLLEYLVTHVADENAGVISGEISIMILVLT
ncbi:hypothetical protein ZIOFF_026594 [Zingiber officinale]|uniref:poly(A)-specific ribonuclease n=1 Tax=Zingiber officinale TaxID=94328 RepID=A0A8J5GXP3_ZINOF|nr:hypothetical protein ZIOFF_026594 [Zingiber officinale]